jgi:hypothetical protein
MLPLPMPWNATYLGYWTDFLHLLSVQSASWPALRVIAAAGPTSVSDETSMPDTPAENMEWQQQGYTQSEYVTAWQTVFQAYAVDFPQQYISLSGDAGTDSIVDINSAGQPAGDDLGTKQEVVDQAIKELGNHFVLQNSSLRANADVHTASIAYVIGYIGRVLTGFQMGPAAKSPMELRKAVLIGLQKNSAGLHVNYFEVHHVNVIATNYRSVLTYAASLLAQHPNPVPTFPVPRGTPCGTRCS